MRRRLIILIPLVFVMIHSACVLAVSMINPSFTTPTGFSPSMQGWLLLCILDLPVALLSFVFGVWSAASPGNIGFVTLYFFVAGGLQWWLIGWCIARFIAWAKALPEPGKC